MLFVMVLDLVESLKLIQGDVSGNEQSLQQIVEKFGGVNKRNRRR